MRKPPYIQHAGKVIELDERFKHVMALTLDPLSQNRIGIVRCITSRSSEPGVSGNIDHSVLHLVSGESLDHFKITDPLKIKGEAEILHALLPRDSSGWECIGLEDPDVWIDELTNRYHLFFTIPFVNRSGTKDRWRISLGHAEGKDLHSLSMTEPPLMDDGAPRGKHKAKEVCIAPRTKHGTRFNLFESNKEVRIGIAENMHSSWQFGSIAFNTARRRIPWILNDASPGPLLPSSFLDLGTGRRLGILNGHSKAKDGSYGTFSIGLFIYDYEHGKITWVSPDHLIKDTGAKNITFASHFVETAPGEGVLYAHVDDSFVRAYTLYAEGIRPLLP